MEIVRDFSDEAKNSLLNAIEAAEQRKHGLLFLSEFWDFISDWAIPGKMSDYQMIEEYYKNIANKHDITKEQLNTIFTNAYAAEARFIARMKPIRAEMDALNTSLLDLVNLVDISPLERGETVLLALPVDEFGQKLSNITAPYQQAVYDRVCSYDEAGNIVYNWDAIDDILNKAPGDITELEYCILAELYSAMGTEDTTKFLQALADKTADVESSSGSPSSYTEWAYDPEKVEHLIGYVDYFAGIITVQQQILSDYSAEDISVLYFSQYPEQIGREIDFQEQRSWLLGELHDERLSTVQQSAFLSLAGSLATQPTACESSPIPGVMFESPILTGAFNAFGPTISLQEMADGYELTFCNTRQITTLKMGSNQQFVPCVTIENLNQNTLWVHSPTIQTNTTRVVADNAEIYYTARYSFDFTDTAVSGSARFLRDQFSSRMLENISANLAGSMAQGASRFTSRMIGFIPVAGDIISFAIDMGTDYMAEKAEAEQNLSDALATLDAVRLSAYCTDLRLTTVVVSDGTPAQQLLLYPGPRTPQILQNINAYLVDNEDVVLPEGLIPPITESDVLGNPGGVDALLQGMSDRDHNRVLDQWG